VAADTRQGVSELQLEQLTFDRVLEFLHDLEHGRHNGISVVRWWASGLGIGMDVPETDTDGL
jgi:hypothetical protein